jgi:acyl-CoA thioesterase I
LSQRSFLIACFVLVLVNGVLFFKFFSSETPSNKTESSPKKAAIVVCFGDSLTKGYGASTGADYPSILAQKVGKPVINEGISGDTTAEALERLEDDVLDHNPDIVLITIGGNDMKNGVPVAKAKENILAMISQIRATGARIILGGVNPPIMSRNYPKMYHDIEEETDILIIPDILQGIMGDDDLMSDMIHPNDQGYKLVAEKFYEKMQEL